MNIRYPLTPPPSEPTLSTHPLSPHPLTPPFSPPYPPYPSSPPPTQALIRIPRSRLDLTVTYARVIASLARVFNDIAEPVVDALRREFHGMMKTKNQGSDNTQYMTHINEIVRANTGF